MVMVTILVQPFHEPPTNQAMHQPTTGPPNLQITTQITTRNTESLQPIGGNGYLYARCSCSVLRWHVHVATAPIWKGTHAQV